MSNSKSKIPTRDLTADAANPLPLKTQRRKREQVTLTRDCQALKVPEGEPGVLAAGSEVTIIQALGGSYSVEYADNLWRIDAVDADALGKEPLALSFPPPENDAISRAAVEIALKTVYDPEIPVNILDLGLIYRLEIGVGDPGKVNLTMTLTSPFCGMGEVLKQEVVRRVSLVPNVRAVEVDIVFDPPWSRENLSEVAKLELGLF